MTQIQRMVIRDLLRHGRRVKPRGQWVTELTGLQFRLTNPRARLVLSDARKFSLPFAVGEFCWYARGSNRLDIISHYSKRYSQFSDDGQTLYGAYGKRLFSAAGTGQPQWDAARKLLQTDPDTRQAVMHLHLPEDTVAESRDIPCTCYLQFFIRQGRLELIVNMRSNDIIWGTSYDAFSFTMLQELMARQLGVEPGAYTHFAGSMHIYDRHLEMAEQILLEPEYPLWPMPVMPADPLTGLRELLDAEEQLRNNRQCISLPEAKYWRDLAVVLQIYAAMGEGDTALMSSLGESLPQCYQTLLSRSISRNVAVEAGAQ